MKFDSILHSFVLRKIPQLFFAVIDFRFTFYRYSRFIYSVFCTSLLFPLSNSARGRSYLRRVYLFFCGISLPRQKIRWWLDRPPEIGSHLPITAVITKPRRYFADSWKRAVPVQPAARCITRRAMQKPASARKASRDNHRHVTAARPAPFLRALRGPNPTEEAP